MTEFERRHIKTSLKATLVMTLVFSVIGFVSGPYIGPWLFSFFPQIEFRNAVCQGDISRINHALSRGAEVNDRFSFAGRNALMTAAIHGKNEMAVVLIAHGADVDARDDKGNTAFQLAQKEKHFDTAALLTGR